MTFICFECGARVFEDEVEFCPSCAVPLCPDCYDAHALDCAEEFGEEF